MIITPAKFEDKMREISVSQDPESWKTQRAVKLMMSTLRSMGYEAGVRIFEEGDKHEDRAD